MEKMIFNCTDNPYNPPTKRKNKPVKLKEGDIVYSIKFAKTIKVVKNKLKEIYTNERKETYYHFTNLVSAPNVEDFEKCINPPNDASYHYYFYEGRNEAVLFFSNEKDAYKIIIDQLVPRDIKNYQNEANKLMEQYVQIVDKITESEKEIEFYKSKL